MLINIATGTRMCVCIHARKTVNNMRSHRHCHCQFSCTSPSQQPCMRTDNDIIIYCVACTVTLCISHFLFSGHRPVQERLFAQVDALLDAQFGIQDMALVISEVSTELIVAINGNCCFLELASAICSHVCMSLVMNVDLTRICPC